MLPKRIYIHTLPYIHHHKQSSIHKLHRQFTVQAYTHTHIASVRTYMHACMCTYTIHKSANHMYVQCSTLHQPTHTYIHTYRQTHIHPYILTCTHVYTHSHTYMHAHTQAYTHDTYIRTITFIYYIHTHVDCIALHDMTLHNVTLGYIALRCVTYT